MTSPGSSRGVPAPHHSSTGPTAAGLFICGGLLFLVGGLCVVVGVYHAGHDSSETHPEDYLGIGAILAFFGVGAMLAAVASAIDKVETLYRQLAAQPGNRRRPDDLRWLTEPTD